MKKGVNNMLWSFLKLIGRMLSVMDDTVGE